MWEIGQPGQTPNKKEGVVGGGDPTRPKNDTEPEKGEKSDLKGGFLIGGRGTSELGVAGWGQMWQGHKTGLNRIRRAARRTWKRRGGKKRKFRKPVNTADR